MNTTIESLQALYVKNGGNLTDTYSDICGGAAVGNYTTIPDMVAACAKLNIGSGGGGAEKFVVTLTEKNDTWTADKTVAKIVAADADGQIVVAKYPVENGYIELPLSIAVDVDDALVALFVGIDHISSDAKIVSVSYFTDGTDTNIDVTEQTVANAPLVVTLTLNDPQDPEETASFVGDKTYGEVFTAVSAGTPCTLVLSAAGTSVATPVLSAVSSNGTIMLYTYDTDSSAITSIQGSSSDYVTITTS
jgi:hypothetical protein